MKRFWISHLHLLIFCSLVCFDTTILHWHWIETWTVIVSSVDTVQCTVYQFCGKWPLLVYSYKWSNKWQFIVHNDDLKMILRNEKIWTSIKRNGQNSVQKFNTIHSSLIIYLCRDAGLSVSDLIFVILFLHEFREGQRSGKGSEFSVSCFVLQTQRRVLWP